MHCTDRLSDIQAIHLLRHGQSMMNLLLGLNDPTRTEIPIECALPPSLLANIHTLVTDLDKCSYDSKLTPLGAQQARDAAKSVRSIKPAPEVVLVSPLSRALQTAELAFEGSPLPRVAIALARERLWCSSEVGTPRCIMDELL